MAKIPESPVLKTLMNLMPQPMEYLELQQKTLGDIFYLNTGLLNLLVLARPEYAEHVLQKNAKNYDKGGPIYDALRLIGKDGLVTTNDQDFWLRQRRMMQPHFHRTRLSELVSVMVDAIDEVMLELTLQKEDEPIDLVSVFGRVTMNVIVHALFGTSLDKERAGQLGEDASYAFDRIMILVFLYQFKWMPLPGRQRFNRILSELDEFIYSVIDDRRQNGLKSDLLSMLMNTVDDETNEQMTDEQLRNEVITMFLAGYETTAAALQWAMVFLNNDASVKERVLAEIHDTIGDAKPDLEQLSRLSYMKSVLYETMRLRPPGFWSPRRAIEDDEIDGYHIPAGSYVAVMIHLIHRHEEFWDNPGVFNPDNFSKPTKHPLAWMPFGAGQRLCIGRDFAIMEAQLILVRLFQNFEIRSTSTVSKPRISTTQKVDTLPVYLVKRTPEKNT